MSTQIEDAFHKQGAFPKSTKKVRQQTNGHFEDFIQFWNTPVAARV